MKPMYFMCKLLYIAFDLSTLTTFFLPLTSLIMVRFFIPIEPLELSKHHLGVSRAYIGAKSSQQDITSLATVQ